MSGGCVTEGLYKRGVCVRGGCVAEDVWMCDMLSAPPSTTVYIDSFHMAWLHF